MSFISPSPITAQVAEPTPGSPEDTISYIGEDGAILTFASLGYTGDDLVSPYDPTTIRFSIPPNWRLKEGGEVVLEYDVFTSGSDLILFSNERREYVGDLAVIFNGKNIDNINIDGTGSYTISVQIPSDALKRIAEMVVMS